MSISFGPINILTPEILRLILDCNPDLREAYELKHLIISFYKKCNADNANKELKKIIKDFKDSTIVEMNDFAKTLTRWNKEISNSFIIVNGNKKINNGIIENRNKTIKNIKHNSNGHTNWERFRNRVMYVLNPDTTFRYMPKEDKN